MGTYIFSLMPNEDGDIECIAQESGQQIQFKVTEIDLRRMMRSIQMWKARKESE